MYQERTKEIKDRIISDIWTTFLTQEEKKKERSWRKKQLNKRLVKDRIIRDIMRLIEQPGNEDFYKPKSVNNFSDNNYIEYDSDGDKNRNLIKYFNETNILTLIWVGFLKNLIEYLHKTNILTLTWVDFLGAPFEVREGVKSFLVYLVRKYTHICSFRKYTF